MKLPKVLYVAVKGEKDEEWLEAQRDQIDCIEGDGPTNVGEYKLVGTQELVKRPHVLSSLSEK